MLNGVHRMKNYTMDCMIYVEFFKNDSSGTLEAISSVFLGFFQKHAYLCDTKENKRVGQVGLFP